MDRNHFLLVYVLINRVDVLEAATTCSYAVYNFVTFLKRRFEKFSHL